MDMTCGDCFGTGNICEYCDGTEIDDPNDPDNEAICECTDSSWILCDNCDGLGYESDLPDDDEEDSDDEEDDEEDDEDICPDCDNTGETEDPETGEIEECGCLLEDDNVDD